jgi:rRNA-processing protein FCF1
MGDYKAFISLCLEHGIYAKKVIMEEMGVNEGDFVAITASSGAKCSTIERIGRITEFKPRDEAYMLLSLFDTLASNHYYFLTEFGFTERVSWIPKQYNYVIDVEPAFELLNKNRGEYRAFKTLYSMVESKFIDITMGLRTEGFELREILLREDEDSAELKSAIMKVINDVTNDIETIFEKALQGADLIIGSGTFFSIMLLPVETAFSISGIDTGSFALPDCKRSITVNPFILYWLLSKIFRSDSSRLIPNYIPVRIEQIEDLKEREVPVKMLKLRTYSPSKLCVESFYHSEDDAAQWVRDELFNVFSIKPYIMPGDFLAPFTSPSIVRGLELVGYERESPYKAPFVEATPYGQVIYGGGAIIPRVTRGTEVDVEFFTNPLYDTTRPLILDTNVISMVAFPYKSESPFFNTFMRDREIIIPAIVVYELKRKLEIGKERRNVTYALSRLKEMHAMGLLNLKITGELPPEIIVPEVLPQLAEGKTINDVKYARSDVRDVLIVLEANRLGGVLFTNDVSLRKLALMLGVPSISYNSLLDDAREVVREICKAGKVHKSEVVKAIKTLGLEVRGEEYDEEEVNMALDYLSFSKDIKFEGEYIIYTEHQHRNGYPIMGV